MPDGKIPTGTLLQRLFKTSDISRFLRYYENDMETISFDSHLAQLCLDRGVVTEHVINKAGIERTYGHQIFNGRRKPSRDKVIQLAFGFGMDYDETQELLKFARKSLLYSKVKRDAVIIFALKHKLSVTAVQETLHELGLPLLGDEVHNE